jgi:hypothetical protein
VNGDDTTVLQVAARIVGLGAGVIAAVYVCGAMVLGLRLAIARLPVETVLGEFPRDFVISVGLAQVVLPSLGFATLYAAYRLLSGTARHAPSWPRWAAADSRARRCLAAKALAWTALVAAPGVALPVIQESNGTGYRWDLLFLLIPIALIFLTTLLARDVFAVLAHEKRASWNAVTTVAMGAAIIMVAAVPGCISFASAFSPPRARLCTNGGDRAFAYLVAQTGDQVILGDVNLSPRPIVVVPKDKVSELVVGREASQIPCFVSDK